MALNGIPISEDQCIGDSLDTINDSFVELDSRTLNLSSSVANLATTIASVSSNLSTTIASVSSDLSTTITSLSTTIVSLSTTGLTPYNKLKFTADGSSYYDASSLIGTQTSSFFYRVDINGVVQEPGTTLAYGDYILSAGDLVFSTAPDIGTKIVIVGPSF